MIRKLNVVTLNANRSCGNMAGFCSMLHAVESVCPHWGVICLQETDNKHVHDDSDIEGIVEAVRPHHYFRHYGGEGNVALGMLINSSKIHLLQHMEISARCMSILMCEHNNVPLQLVNIHGHADGDIEATLSEVSNHVHIHTNPHEIVRILFGDGNVVISFGE